MSRRKRRRGFRLDDYVVGRLVPKHKQYTVWDLAVEGCGVRVSSSTRSCVISVRIGQAKKFETIGRIAADQRALKIKSPPARELPVELQSVEGRRRLIEGLKAIDTPLARGCQFICYTGLRRRAAASLSRDHLIANGVLEFKSKTRMVRVPLSRQAAALIDPQSDAGLLHVGDKRLKQPLIKIFGERRTPRGKRARVTPHDLRRYFKSVGTELGIDPTIMNLLVGHTIKGVDKHYIAKLRLSVLRAAAQRIADEIDNPQETSGDDAAAVVAYASPPKPQDIGDYLFHRELPTLDALQPTRHAHYFAREDLYRSVWTAPVAEIALRLGISDVGLAKACRRAEIPLPPRGYWAKLTAGQHVAQAPLPDPPPGLPTLIRITATRPPVRSFSLAA